MRTQPNPAALLTEGVAVLRPVLEPHGFAFVSGAVGASSGGTFASGEFVRGNRRLELHVRHGLGQVQYRIGEAILDHESYLRYGGHWQGHEYPNFSEDPLTSFSALANDLGNFCQEFLFGSGEEFLAFAAEHKRNPGRFKGFQALGKNGG